MVEFLTLDERESEGKGEGIDRKDEAFRAARMNYFEPRESPSAEKNLKSRNPDRSDVGGDIRD